MAKDLIETIVCSKCLNEKPVSEFRKDSHNSTGYHPHCNSCANKNQRKFYNENIEHARAYANRRYLNNSKLISEQRKARRENKKLGIPTKKGGPQRKIDLSNEKFIAAKEKNWKDKGIKDFTFSDYLRMQEEQGFVCYLCKNPPSDKRNLCVDHNHKTGRVRALLCNNCNNGIGKLRDSIELLQKAVEYLKLFDHD